VPDRERAGVGRADSRRPRRRGGRPDAGADDLGADRGDGDVRGAALPAPDAVAARPAGVGRVRVPSAPRGALGSRGAFARPGGLGAGEAALTPAVTISGRTAETATSAVLLYRLLTLWLRVVPGWAAFAYLQRREAL